MKVLYKTSNHLTWLHSGHSLSRAFFHKLSGYVRPRTLFHISPIHPSYSSSTLTSLEKLRASMVPDMSREYPRVPHFYTLTRNVSTSNCNQGSPSYFFFLKFITVHFEESTCKVKKISRVYLVMSHIVFRRMVSSRTQPKCLIFSKHHMKFTPLFISFYSFLYKKNPSV